MSLEQNWCRVCEKVEEVCLKAARNPDDITIIAVSKTVAIEAMAKAYDLGIRHFGESRLQEALPKISALPKDICWHYLGRLQSNKIRKVAESFDVIHAVDCTSHAKDIEKAQKKIDALISVNVAQETQKSGVFVENLDELVDSLLCSQLVRFRGLMTIGPLVDDPENSRAIFKELAQLGANYKVDWLSMGMSADYDVAIQEGATHIRVGSAIFGERN